ncbi:MAG: ATP-binding protein, partial [Hyphomicrobiaceae bacterium]
AIEGRCPELLRNLMVNILTNAQRYGAEPKHVAIEMSASNDWQRIELTNRTQHSYTNPDELFSPFIRGEAADTEGSGLGLSICKRIMDLHDSRISIDTSRKGEFKVILEFKTRNGTQPASQ